MTDTAAIAAALLAADLAREVALAAIRPIARVVRPTRLAEAQMLGIWRGLLEPAPGLPGFLRLKVKAGPR